MKSIGPFINRDLGGFDRPRGLFSGMPVGADFLCDYMMDFEDFTGSVMDQTNNWISIIDVSCTTLIGTGDLENGAVTLLSNATTDNVGAAIQRAESGFIPTTGPLVRTDLKTVVPNASGGTKTVSKDFPIDALAWLEKQMATQGASLESLRDLNESTQSRIASDLNNSQATPPPNQPVPAQGQGA